MIEVGFRHVTDELLVKKSGDGAIEETDLCFGCVCSVWFKETDDLVRCTPHLMDTHLSKQHTRLRVGTVIPFTALFLDGIIDKLGPAAVPPRLELASDLNTSSSSRGG